MLDGPPWPAPCSDENDVPAASPDKSSPCRPLCLQLQHLNLTREMLCPCASENTDQKFHYRTAPGSLRGIRSNCIIHISDICIPGSECKALLLLSRGQNLRHKCKIQNRKSKPARLHIKNRYTKIQNPTEKSGFWIRKCWVLDCF